MVLRRGLPEGAQKAETHPFVEYDLLGMHPSSFLSAYVHCESLTRMPVQKLSIKSIVQNDVASLACRARKGRALCELSLRYCRRQNHYNFISDRFKSAIVVGHTPSTAGTFQKTFRKNSGKTPETLSERLCPKPYNSRHLRLPERFQNSLPPSTAGDTSFFRSGSGKGLSELVKSASKCTFCNKIIGWLRNRTGTGNRNRRNRFSRNRKRNRNRRNRSPGTETGTGTVLSC